MKRLMTLLLVACLTLSGAALAQGFEPALDTDTACEVRVYGNYSNFEALEAQFDAFNDIYPDVYLSYTRLDDYNNLISTAVAGEDSPDIFMSFTWMYGKPMYDALFDNMADLKAAGIDTGVLRAGLISDGGTDALTMLPVFSTTYGMLVNEDLFEKAHIAVPTSYTELKTACAALKDAGYATPILGYYDVSGIYSTIAYVSFYRTLAEHPETVAALNALEASSAEMIRPTLERVKAFVDDGLIDAEACAAIEDGYNAQILRFFEGDVPMLFASGDTVSGTLKREFQSEAFSAHPFEYAFHPLPVDDSGLCFADIPSVELSVSKNSRNLDMAFEFMRFLYTEEQLEDMAQIKRLLSPCEHMSVSGVYAPFSAVDASLRVYPQALGVMDEPVIQMRKAAWNVATGAMTVDEAVAAFGTLE